MKKKHYKIFMVAALAIVSHNSSLSKDISGTNNLDEILIAEECLVVNGSLWSAEGGSIKIQGEGNVTINSIKGPALGFSADIEANELNINAMSSSANGIEAGYGKNVTLDVSKITVNSDNNGIYAHSNEGGAGNVYINNVNSLTINAKGQGIDNKAVNGKVIITGAEEGTSEVNISSTSEAGTTSAQSAVQVSRSNGLVSITADKIKISSEGLNEKSHGLSIINRGTNGEINLQGSDITINSINGIGISTESLNSNILVNGKNVNITSENGDGISSTGKKSSVTISGSDTIEIFASRNAVFADSNAVININKNEEKGTVIIKGDIVSEGTSKINIDLVSETSSLTGKITTNETILLSSEAAETNVTLSNGAIWNNTGNSNVTNLESNNGIVNLEHASEHQTVTINKLNGNGSTFIMDVSSDDIDQNNGKTDFLDIKTVDNPQKHYILIGGNSINGLTHHNFADEAILIADADKNINFEGKAFTELGNVYDYTPILDTNLRAEGENGNNWYITGIKNEKSQEVEAIEDFSGIRYMDVAMARLELDTLHKRLGDIRNYNTDEGVWIRTSGGKMKHDDLSNKYGMVQVGYDESESDEKGRWFTGLGFHYRHSDLDFDNGDGKGNSYGISLYKSWISKDNQYLDLIGKYSFIDNKLDTHNINNENVNGKYKTWAGTLGTEYGRRFYTDDKKWYLQPNAQMTYTHLYGKNYSTNSGLRVYQDNINSFIGRLGAYAGYELDRSNHFLKFSFLREFDGDYNIKVKGKDGQIKDHKKGKDNWVELGIGGDFQVGKTDDFSIYYEIERTFGADYELKLQGTLGFRYSFNSIDDIINK